MDVEARLEALETQVSRLRDELDVSEREMQLIKNTLLE